MYSDRVIGMGDWSDSLPAWARVILRGAETAFPTLLALDVGAQALVAAIVDLKPQRARIIAAMESLNNEWGFANEATANIGGIPLALADSYIAQMQVLDAALEANGEAMRNLSNAIDVAQGASVVIPGLSLITGAGVSAFGLGEPITATVIVGIGIAGAVILVAGGFVVAEMVIPAYTKANAQLAANAANTRVQGAWATQAIAAIQQGRPIPAQPQISDPAKGSTSQQAINAVVTVAALGIGAFVLLKWFGKGAA